MSEQIKYEAVFGDQGLFDEEFEPKAIAVILEPGAIRFLAKTNEEINNRITKSSFSKVIAMRRIIKTPVWTKSDKMAGKLPEVGCIVRVSPTENAKVVAVNTKMSVMAVQCNDESIDVLDIHEILPFETEAERQQREEDEFVSSINVDDYSPLLSGVAFKTGVRAAYRKLKMPEVQK